jgi:hypothetical protein
MKLADICLHVSRKKVVHIVAAFDVLEPLLINCTLVLLTLLVGFPPDTILSPLLNASDRKY